MSQLIGQPITQRQPHLDRIEKVGFAVRISREHGIDPGAVIRLDDQERADHGVAVIGQKRSAGFDRVGIGAEIIEMRDAVGEAELMAVRLVEADRYVVHSKFRAVIFRPLKAGTIGSKLLLRR
jgi:hypothetical protein